MALSADQSKKAGPDFNSTMLTSEDLHLFNEGSHSRLYNKLGSHPATGGTYFSVWAPNAEAVFVMGDFNGWNKSSHVLISQGVSGIWAVFIDNVKAGTLYKYHIVSRHNGIKSDKADPMAFYHEAPPKTASIVWSLDYEWQDKHWMCSRGQRQKLESPQAVYEVHLGSWRRVVEEGARPLTYREMAEQLPGYVKSMGFTHVEFLPVMEHPFYGSWGYQTSGYFAPTSRYGTPQDFMHLVDTLHQHAIGVILDFSMAHFPSDAHGLAFFDGTHLYEHADPQKGWHPDWNSCIFNYGRHEVRSFLISVALFWLEKYHIDGLRFDAVASMLYLDYSRNEGQWSPNEHGGRENLDAIHFLRRLNEEIYQNYPDVQTIAEESTAWPMVSRPTYAGGLGFGLKWDMGWMHDTLRYLKRDPIHRQYHQNGITFRMVYAFHENFMLPLSHDEVVHGKGSLLAVMPGDDSLKFANLRLLYSYQYAQPGKKLLFMGCELGQWHEWSHDASLDWNLLEYKPHAGLKRLVRDLNAIYSAYPAMHALDCDSGGFEWIDASDAQSSILSFIRKDADDKNLMLAVFNLTPVMRTNYRVGAPWGGFWKEILNSDGREYGGTGCGNYGGVQAEEVPIHGRNFSLNLTLPPLSGIFFKRMNA
ncbi:MAG: 1,4-alpha-glucan branching protein GlgB [Elusimicrobia bacterium]|nr:1,4-alpha-glucan branching protein GlgB [Elusimicrobiota bacterium]